MTRKERLKYCTICTNRKLDLQKGLLCGLTNEYASFETNCIDFNEDEREKNLKFIRDLDASGHQNASQSLNFKANKDNGALILLIGIALLLFMFINVGSLRLLIIPFGVIAYGARTYNKGVEQQKIMEQRVNYEQERKTSISETLSDKKQQKL